MLSVIIPLIDEAESLPQLHVELSEVAAAQKYDLEIIFIDDGSQDRSWEIIRQFAACDSRVRGIRFRRNFGKSAALEAGFRAARGNRVITLDADLQDDPHEFPRLLEKLEQGFDLVSGWKRIRHDPWHKVFPSRVFNWSVSVLTGVHLHDHNCGLKAYRREVIDELHLYGDMHRFVPVLAAARGFRVAEIEVHHRERRFGYSKYGVRRFAHGFIDLLTVKFLTAFGERPQHFFGELAIASIVFGLLLFAVPLGFHDLIFLMFALTGLGLLAIGFLAALLLVDRHRAGQTYAIVEQLNEPAEPTPTANRQPP